MNTQTFNTDALAVTDIVSINKEYDLSATDLSGYEEIDLLMNEDAANEDFMDIIEISEEDWDAATADGFLIF